jgi:glucosylceramidase
VLIMKPILFPASTAYLLLLLMACTQTPQPTTERAAEPASYSTDQKTVIAYETAAAGNVRMQASPSRTFTHHGQPVETQTLVFVNPDQTYQTFVGIGGAITDASAETFAKLSPQRNRKSC